MSKLRDRTFRVRNLPSHIDRHEAIELLARLDSSLGPTDNIRIFSLASSLNPWERPPTKTATVMFKRQPALFENDKLQWVLPAQGAGLYRNIIIDVHFLDFTVLNDVNPDSYEIDCIAISGLASHPFGSWMERGGTNNFMWLRDRLPRDMPYLRSIIYGYDTQLLNSESTQTIDDIATNFIVQLRSFGRTSLSAKPLVLLAHSLGGIILKRAIVLLANSGDLERSMLDSIKQVILFGVPHHGMQISHLLPMVDGQPNQSLIEFLATGSLELKDLGEQFDGIATLRNIQIVSVYETKRSQIPKLENGTWSREGSFELLVDRNSAIHKTSLPRSTLPVNEDHSNIVKFSEDDSQYRGVLSFLLEVENQFSSVSVDVSDSVQSISQDYKTAASYDSAVAHCTVSMSSTSISRAQVWKTGDLDSIRHPEDLLKQEAEDEKESSNMLESLEVTEDGRRFSEIYTTKGTTFDWIFSNSSLGYASWARSGHGLYWISGKPGSGKSTFMKFIYQDPRTSTLLNQSNVANARRIKASFFFHDRGTYVQKSFEGLLRSILHQILYSEPALNRLVLPIFRAMKDRQKRTLRFKDASEKPVWTVDDLEQSFAMISSQESFPLNICLFLDALDEYDGSSEAIVSFIKSLIEQRHFSCSLQTESRGSSKTNFQVCFSSRPWNIFFDEFSTYSGLRIHDHTCGDIKIHILDKIRESKALKNLFKPKKNRKKPKMDKFVKALVEKSQGVFLWVKLIMSELHMACTDGASMGELSTILATLPEQLDEFYQRTIERIPKQHRLQSYIMFETVLRSTRAVNVHYLEYALACAQETTLDGCMLAIQNIDFSATEIDLSRRIRSRSGGLLEVDGNLVKFMHQTIKDFAEGPDFRCRVIGNFPNFATENGHSFLSKLSLCLLAFRSATTSKGIIMPQSYLLDAADIDTICGLQIESFYHFNLAESTTGKSQRQFLNSMNRRTFEEAFRVFYAGYIGPDCWPINSPASFAAVASLGLYMREHLCEDSVINMDPRNLLLHCTSKAINVSQTQIHCREMHLYLNLNHEDMIRLLLAAGADLGYKHDGMNSLQVLMSCVDRTNRFKANKYLFEIVKTFLEHGQNPDTEIDVYGSIRVNRSGHILVPTPFKGSLVRCKLLHVAPVQLLKALLESKADINALDSLNLTPLDSLLFSAANRTREDIISSGYLSLYESILIFIRQGARITSDGAQHFEKAAMHLIEDFGWTPQLQRPQRLEL